jgi:hypothetical protein
MNPTFKPPVTDEEFKERSKDVTLAGATAVLHSLKERRKALVVSIDQEIAFYERIITERGEKA